MYAAAYHSPWVMIHGVWPFLLTTSSLAPRSKSSCVSSVPPKYAAPCMAASPLLFTALMSSPSSRQSLTATAARCCNGTVLSGNQRRWYWSSPSPKVTPAAAISAVVLSFVVRSGLAPPATSRRIIPTSAYLAAIQNGVAPASGPADNDRDSSGIGLVSRAVGSAPC